MPGAVAIRRANLVAQFDAADSATLSDLEPLCYASGGGDGLPAHVRAASALRRFENRLVIVQDDVNALAVRDARGAVRPVLLPAHGSGRRVFDDTLGNKLDKLDLEACVTLPDGRLVAFGSGSTAQREQLAVWRGASAPAEVVAAAELYRELRAAIVSDGGRLNIEGAVVCGRRLELFHRGNDARAAVNAIVEVDCDELVAWLDAGAAAPQVVSVTTVDLGSVRGVPFGFTDAAAFDGERVIVLACAEDTACAVSDGAVLGCRVGTLDRAGLRTVDVCDAAGERTLLKLEGIERRAGADGEFDVVVDVDRSAVPAQLGRLTWERH